MADVRSFSLILPIPYMHHIMVRSCVVLNFVFTFAAVGGSARALFLFRATGKKEALVMYRSRLKTPPHRFPMKIALS
jgi:hypothetical protein